MMAEEKKEDKFQEIETERLHLRKIHDEDASMLFKNIYNNFEWYKYYYQLPFQNFEEYQQLVAKYKTWYEIGNHFRWGIVLKEAQEMIGLVQLHTKDELNNHCKLGYIIGYQYHHQGYAKEAVNKVIDFAFDTLGYHRIEADIVVKNQDSIHLAESLGMEMEAVQKESYRLEEQYLDQKVYVLLNRKK